MNEQWINLIRQKSGFRNIPFSVAMSVGVISAIICILLITRSYSSARSKLDTYNLEVRGWEACRQMNPSYFAACKETVSLSRKNLDEARNNFWMKLSKAQFTGLFVLITLGSGIGGYLVTWAVLWFVGLSIHRYIRPTYANQVRGSPPVSNAGLAHYEQDSHGWRGLRKDHFAHVPDEYGKQKKPGAVIRQFDKLHEQIKQLQHEITISRQTEVRLEQQIANLVAADKQSQYQVVQSKRTEEHHKQQTNEQPVTNRSFRRSREQPQRDGKHDATHHINDRKAGWKLCRKCKKQKAESDFHKDRSCKDGLARWCKECKAEAARKYHKKQKAMKNYNTSRFSD